MTPLWKVVGGGLALVVAAGLIAGLVASYNAMLKWKAETAVLLARPVGPTPAEIQVAQVQRRFDQAREDSLNRRILDQKDLQIGPRARHATLVGVATG
jgi:hypothetical protein